ncbi:MAG: cation:proton antiporter [Armatimonadetes bacterium]|nr:cation:proton antiporter [Armatimonadota bacterium]
MQDISVLRDFLAVVAVSLAVVYAVGKLRVPTVVGFLVSGVLLGPKALGLVRDIGSVEAMAEIGVVLLLFTIGLKFPLSEVVRLRGLVFGAGGLQMALTATATAVAAVIAGASLPSGVYYGFLLAMSSTAIVLKLLEVRGEVDAPHGRLMMSVLIMQDLAVVPLMLLVPVLAAAGTATWMGPLSGLARSLAVVALILAAARLLLPRLIEMVVRTRSPEVFTLAIVAVALGTAYFAGKAGLSLGIGAFLAGIVISETHYAHHVTAQVMPLRDVLSSLFFISIGMMVSPAIFVSSPATVLGGAALVIVGKTLLMALVGLFFRVGLRNAVMAGWGLGQVGEFSFVLAQAGARHGLLDEHSYQLFLSVSVLTMAVTPLLLQLAPAVAARVQKVSSGVGASLPTFSKLRPRRPAHALHKKLQEAEDLHNHVVLVGYGVNGRNVARVLKRKGIPYVVLELNPSTVRRIQAQGEKVIYGDACRRELLSLAGVAKARALVVSIADPVATRCIVAVARAMNPGLRIIVRTRFVVEVDQLHRQGADDIVPEEFETSLALLGLVMQAYGMSEEEIEAEKATIRREGYALLRPEAEYQQEPSLEDDRTPREPNA